MAKAKWLTCSCNGCFTNSICRAWIHASTFTGRVVASHYLICILCDCCGRSLTRTFTRRSLMSRYGQCYHNGNLLMKPLPNWRDARNKQLIMDLTRFTPNPDPRNAQSNAEQELSEEVNECLYDVSAALRRKWDENASSLTLTFSRSPPIISWIFQPNCLLQSLSAQESPVGQHVMEQRANNCIIRPNADYVGVGPRTHSCADQRKIVPKVQTFENCIGTVGIRFLFVKEHRVSQRRHGVTR